MSDNGIWENKLQISSLCILFYTYINFFHLLTTCNILLSYQTDSCYFHTEIFSFHFVCGDGGSGSYQLSLVCETLPSLFCDWFSLDMCLVMSAAFKG